MNRTIILITIFSLLLTACGEVQTFSTQASDEVPITTQLVLGTLQLEGTAQAVSGEQAKELLPMWQVYKSLSNSGVAAEAEIDGLIEQIQETMTAGQMDAISAINLTQQDVFTAMQEQGGDFVQARQTSNSSTQSEGGMPGSTPLDDGGGMVGGAPPDGSMDDIGGVVPGDGTDQNQEAGAGPGQGSSAGVPTVLIEALIQYLEQIANS